MQKNYFRPKIKMKVDLLILQASHLFYFIAATIAWNKGYKGFSIALFVMIAVSLINHRAEELFNDDASALEWFEKIVVIVTGTYGAVIFREHIDVQSWLILSLSIIFFCIGSLEYYRPGAKNNYIFAHTLWHIGTGYAIVRIVSAAPNNISSF